MQTLLRDVIFGARVLARGRLFTLAAVSLLALGIGANTAMFSVVNAVLLRALPYRDADRLVELYPRGASGNREFFSRKELEAFQQRMHTLEALAAATNQSVNLTGGERPARVRGAFVSASFFEVFRVTPVVGRSFLPGDDRPGAARVAVVSERLWQERLSSDRTLMNATLTFNGEPHHVIGVVSPRFKQPFETEAVDVWLPVSSHPLGAEVRALYGLGYLAEGRALGEARAEAATIAAQLAALDPAGQAGRSATVEFVREFMASRARPLLGSLFAAAGLILLIACANLANLLLARGLGRRREFSIRAALGASRWQLMRQLLTEATLLGLAGGALGLVVAPAALAALLAIPQSFVPVEDVTPDGRVLLFTLSLSVLTAWLFGLLPALQLSRPELWSFSKDGARGSGDGPRLSRVRGAFVVAQVALSLLLLVGAALLFQSFDKLLHVDVGFEPRGLLTLEYRLPPGKYPQLSEQAEIHRRIVEEIRAIPGVDAAALTSGLPFSGNGLMAGVTFPERPPAPPGDEAKVLFGSATPDYFSTLGIELVEGRRFDVRDRLDTQAVIIINQAMARRFWPDRGALGRSISVPSYDLVATVVGRYRRADLSRDRRFGRADQLARVLPARAAGDEHRTHAGAPPRVNARCARLRRAAARAPGRGRSRARRARRSGSGRRR